MQDDVGGQETASRFANGVAAGVTGRDDRHVVPVHTSASGTSSPFRVT